MSVQPAFRAEKIELLSPAVLKRASRNARTHSKRQLRQVADSIERYGFINPIVIDETNTIVGGHGRVAAADLLGMTEVPCIRVGRMSAEEKRAYALADNAIALKSGWDDEILSGELRDLIDAGFDAKFTGFEAPEIDKLLFDQDEASPKRGRGDPDEAPPAPLPEEAVSRLGDFWILGRHRVACGDAKSAEVVAALMAGDKADAVFTDPPFNVRIDGHATGKGRHRHREFLEASGEMSRPEFIAFLQESLGVTAQVCRPGAILFVCMDWRHMLELITAGEAVGLEQKNLCVWTKSNGGMGAFYRSQHELVTVWKAPGAPHTNTFGLGEGGRSRTNVWPYAGANAFKAERAEELAIHPTVKPVALVMDAIRDVTHRGETVLDVFGGSGTTLIAAHKVGRTARLVELDPAYCDVIVRRWEKLTGKAAVLEATRDSFEIMAERRREEASAGAAASTRTTPTTKET